MLSESKGKKTAVKKSLEDTQCIVCIIPGLHITSSDQKSLSCLATITQKQKTLKSHPVVHPVILGLGESTGY